jgi:chemotaxis protein CheD
MEKKDCRYGIFAIEKLIHKVLELGAKKENLKAKIFGASYMGILQKQESRIKIQEKNMTFAETYLKMAKLPIVHRYIGKEYALKLTFRTDTGETIVKDIITTRQ